MARTPAKTVRVIKQQIWAACSGVQDTVDELQTSTSVKDKTALFWIEKLIVKARETQKERFNTDPRLKNKNLKGDARKAVKTRIRDLIQWELYNWVILQPEDRAAKLPKNSGEYLFQCDAVLHCFNQWNVINCGPEITTMFYCVSEVSWIYFRSSNSVN